MREPTSRVAWGLVAAATAAGVALRFAYLGNQSLWYDETFTRAIVTAPGIGDVWRGVKSTEATPPLYYLVTWGWAKLFGIHSDPALRATSAIASAACVPAAFAALRRFTGDRAAIAAAALVAVSPMLVWYALDARAYSLLVLFALLSLWALSLLLERPTRRRWVAWALAAGAAVWTHYFGGFLVAAEVGVLLWRLPARRAATLVAAAAVAVLCAPLLWAVSAQSDARTDHIGSLPLGERLGQAARQLAMGPNVPHAWLEAIGLVLAAAGLGVGVWAARRDARLGPLVAIGAAVVAVPLLLSLTDIEDRLLARNLLVAFPCVAGLAAVGLMRARDLPLALFVVTALVAVVWVEGDWRYQNADWRGAARALPPRAQRDLVALFPKLDRPVAQLYLDRRYVANRVSGTTWAMIAPARIGRRELRPAEIGPAIPPGFALGETLSHHGFRIVEVRATPVAGQPPPLALGRDLLGSAPSLLVPER